MADKDTLYTIITTVEAVILNRQTTGHTAFLDAWDLTTAEQRQTIYHLYHLALRDAYYDRGSLGQTVIRAVLAL